MKYFADYEALVYNMPECNGFEFLDHQFIAHPVTAEDEKFIVPNNDMLKANFSFQACCLTYSDNHSSYITAQNKTPLEIDCDNMSDDELHDKAGEMVRKRIEDMEQYLILTTNLHIFFPVVKINIRSEDGQKSLLCGFMNNRPMPFRKWTWIAENINLECRLHFHLDKESFDKFRLHKSRTRYNRAFDYYIRSFYEFDHSSAFCILCSALDAITGCSNSNKTKERLAKYSSVLFCTPLEMEQLKSKMQRLYKLRSDFTHGKGSKITVQDEIELREYVRKFLLAYFLFWQEMKIKNEPQMPQKLDEILEDHSLYIKYAPAAYEFVRLTEEHEKQPGGIIQKSMPEKYALAVVKMLEALIKLPAPPSSEDTAQEEGNNNQ